MRRACLSIGFLCAASWLVYARTPGFRNPVLGVVMSSRTFAIGSVEQKPESGPIIVTDGDQVTAFSTPVMFRLTGENRVVLGNGSISRIRAWEEDGHYFYLSKGSIEYDARRQPLAICARDLLYVPSVPGSGVVVIRDDNKVDVRLTIGKMVRSGSEACNAKAAPLFLTNGVSTAAATGGAAAGSAGTAAGTVAGTAASTAAGAAGSAAAAGATATATATATAAAAGIGAAIPAAASVAVATASAAGVVASTATTQTPPPTQITTQAPPSQSPITPGP